MAATTVPKKFFILSPYGDMLVQRCCAEFRPSRFHITRGSLSRGRRSSKKTAIKFRSDRLNDVRKVLEECRR